MLRISDIRIGTKLMAMSGVGVLLMAGMLATQMISSSSVMSANETAALQQNLVRSLESARAFERGIDVGARDILLAQTAENLKKAAKYVGEQQHQAHIWLDPLSAKLSVPEDRARVQKIIASIDHYAASVQEIAAARTEVMTLANKDNQTADIALQIAQLKDKADHIAREQTLPLVKEIESLLARAAEVADRVSVKEAARASSEMISTRRNDIIIGGAIIAVLIASAIFGFISIARPLMALTDPINKLASGNFSVAVSGVGRKDEVGQIATAVNAMAERIRSTIGEIKRSATEVNSASSEISTSATDLSQRTEEQAASLEETSAAMEQLSATVKKNADNAQHANRSASSTMGVADRGSEVVAQAVQAMAKIEDSSRKIADIIGVIDEIARQTNLLALNAAVEAARAGDAGRGFAVVASEVRSLAQRSSQAAKDIKDLITNSNGQVKDGVELVNRAGASLNEIVESIKSVATIVAEIANASTEQATGIEEINRALTQMDQATQQNSALVEENAATARTLENQAKAMDERVAYFQIGEAGETKAAPRDQAPAEKVAPERKAVAPVAKAPARSAQKPVARLKHVAAGNSGAPVRKMQEALASAVNADDGWKEF